MLRHTMATLNYLDGMDPRLLSHALGRSTYAFTFDRCRRGVQAEYPKKVAEHRQRQGRSAKLA